MATDITIGSHTAKQQSVWALLGLSIVTIGIYLLFWYYRVNREMRDAGATFGDAELANVQPGMSVLAMFIPIANLVSVHRTGKRVLRVQQATGGAPDYSMAVHWILILFTGLWFLYTQSVLNHVWSRASSTAGSTGVPVQQPHMAGSVN